MTDSEANEISAAEAWEEQCCMFERRWEAAEEARADAEAQTKDLIAALYRLWIGAAVGTETQRVDAMTAAGDLLARIGALDAEVAHPEPAGG